MNERFLRELIEEATRDVPAAVARPPLRRIRQRVRRRRILWPASVSALLAALAAAAGLALAPASPGPEPVPVLPIPTFGMKESAPSLAPAIGRMRLGTKDWTLHPGNRTFILVWEEGPIQYRLSLEPPEGARVTEAEFRTVARSLTWP